MQKLEVTITGEMASGKSILLNVIGNALLAHGYEVDFRDDFENRPADHDPERVPGGKNFIGDGYGRYVLVRTDIGTPRVTVYDPPEVFPPVRS